jgi:hypothetical protein
MLDRLDGGISLFLRCPGFRLPSNATADKVNVDIYVHYPHELVQNEHINSDVTVLVQMFCQDFVFPHPASWSAATLSLSSLPFRMVSMQQFGEDPTNTLAEFTHPISIKGPHHLPCFTSPLESRIQCTGLPSYMLKQPAAFGTSNDPSPSADICEAAFLIPCANTPSPHTPVRTHSIRKCHLADAFLASVKEISGPNSFRYAFRLFGSWSTLD